MKTFIWDDRNYLCVEDLSQYDMSVFTIARKLFVRWDTKKKNPTNEIIEKFSAFGAVERVEIIRTREDIIRSPSKAKDSRTMQTTHEVYVTFEKSEDAFAAATTKIKPNLNCIVAADTWHQPDYDSSGEPEDLDSTEQANAESSQQNNEPAEAASESLLGAASALSLEEQKNTVKDQSEFVFNLRPGLRLNDVRKTLMGIKHKVVHLRVNYIRGFDDGLSDANNYTIGCFQRRVADLIGLKKFGPQLHTLTLTGFMSLNLTMLQCFEVILKNVKTLNVDVNLANFLFITNKFCPKLKRLEMNSAQWREDHREITDPTEILAWPSLKHLIMKNCRLRLESRADYGYKFRNFIHANSQIETLHISSVVDCTLLKALVDDLPNLKTFIFTQLETTTTDMSKQLFKMKNLSSIAITTYIFKQNNFNLLIKHVESFSKMKNVRMAMLLHNYSTKMCDPIVYSCNFPFQYYESYNGKKRAIVHEGDVIVSDLPPWRPTVVVAIAVTQSYLANDKILEKRIEILLKALTKFYPNVIKAGVVAADDKPIYFQIASRDNTQQSRK